MGDTRIQNGLSANSRKVLEKRYLRKDSEGRVIETPEELCRRVAHNIASADSYYDPDYIQSGFPAEFTDLDERRTRTAAAVGVFCFTCRGLDGVYIRGDKEYRFDPSFRRRNRFFFLETAPGEQHGKDDRRYRERAGIFYESL